MLLLLTLSRLPQLRNKRKPWKPRKLLKLPKLRKRLRKPRKLRKLLPPLRKLLPPLPRKRLKRRKRLMPRRRRCHGRATEERRLRGAFDAAKKAEFELLSIRYPLFRIENKLNAKKILLAVVPDGRRVHDLGTQLEGSGLRG